MRPLLTLITLGLISSAAFSAVDIPAYGMTCEAKGYTLMIIPNHQQSQIEIEIVTAQGKLMDDNIYSAILGKPFVYADRMSNVRIAIVGLEESNLRNTVVFYQNRFLSKEIKFSNCDVM